MATVLYIMPHYMVSVTQILLCILPNYMVSVTQILKQWFLRSMWWSSFMTSYSTGCFTPGTLISYETWYPRLMPISWRKRVFLGMEHGPWISEKGVYFSSQGVFIIYVRGGGKTQTRPRKVTYPPLFTEPKLLTPLPFHRQKVTTPPLVHGPAACSLIDQPPLLNNDPPFPFENYAIHNSTCRWLFDFLTKVCYGPEQNLCPVKLLHQSRASNMIHDGAYLLHSMGFIMNPPIRPLGSDLTLKFTYNFKINRL